MIQDYGKYKKKRQGQTKKVMVLAAIIGLFAVSLIFYLRYRHELTVANVKSMAAHEVSTYFPHIFEKEKAHPAVKKKTPAATAEAAKPVHFDFYDELPKVQVGNLKEAQEEREMAEAEVEEPSPPPVAPSAAKAETKEHFSSKSIEQDLYADLSAMKSSEKTPDTTPYILQIGIFHSQEAANRYRGALQSAGLRVDVVKVKLGSEYVYRIQQGPYRNTDQLKSAKKRLTERGVTCDIRKLAPYEI